jgi:hypothetical protein
MLLTRELEHEMILDDIQTSEILHNEPSISPELQKQIDRLIENEKVQRTRTWSYWEKMRKENPALYRSPAQSAQRIKDAMALGKDFEDGDYND